eukprot:2046509-Ditylum_brightwellii.AAC.1
MKIGHIHVIPQHPLKEQQFDTHQDWMMNKVAYKTYLDSSKEGDSTITGHAGLEAPTHTPTSNPPGVPKTTPIQAPTDSLTFTSTMKSS